MVNFNKNQEPTIRINERSQKEKIYIIKATKVKVTKLDYIKQQVIYRLDQIKILEEKEEKE